MLLMLITTDLKLHLSLEVFPFLLVFIYILFYNELI